MKRRQPLRRKTPLRLVNPERRARLRDEQFGPQAELCRRLPCCVCDQPAEPHHVRSRAAGGKDADCAPLCRVHHICVHVQGQAGFEQLHGVSLSEIAAGLAADLDENA